MDKGSPPILSWSLAILSFSIAIFCFYYLDTELEGKYNNQLFSALVKDIESGENFAVLKTSERFSPFVNQKNPAKYLELLQLEEIFKYVDAGEWKKSAKLVLSKKLPQSSNRKELMGLFKIISNEGEEINKKSEEIYSVKRENKILKNKYEILLDDLTSLLKEELKQSDLKDREFNIDNIDFYESGLLQGIPKIPNIPESINEDNLTDFFQQDYLSELERLIDELRLESVNFKSKLRQHLEEDKKLSSFKEQISKKAEATRFEAEKEIRKALIEYLETSAS